MVAVQTKLSLEEFLRLPEEKPALEYEDGVVTPKISPKAEHSALQTELAVVINSVLRPTRIGRAFTELRIVLGGRAYVPDVSVFGWERIPADERGRVSGDATIPADVAIEILSRGQSGNGLIRRCLWYVANGFKAALLVDDQDESVLVFRPDTVPQAVTGEEKIDLADILPGFELTAKELFDSLQVR